MSEERDRFAAALQSVAAAIPAIGAYLYGLGWMFFAGLAATFDAEPEDLGITFTFLLPRVALSIGVALGLGGFVLLGLSRLERFRTFVRSGAARSMTLFVLILGVTTILYALAFIIVVMAFRLYEDGLPRKGGLVAVALTAGMIMWINWRILAENSGGHKFKPRVSVLAGLALLSSIVPVYAMMWYSGKQVGYQLHTGHQLDLKYVSFPQVAVVTTDSPPSAYRCYLLLGSNGDSFMLFDPVREGADGVDIPAHLIRMPSYDTTLLYGPCKDGWYAAGG